MLFKSCCFQNLQRHSSEMEEFDQPLHLGMSKSCTIEKRCINNEVR